MFARVALLSICVLFSSLANAGDKPWIEVRSPHFRVLTDASQSDARQVAHEFEEMRFVFADRYPSFRLDGGSPLVILAARDEETAKKLAPAQWKIKGAKPAGVFYHSWEREYVLVRMDVWNLGNHDVVYHEYTHSIFHRNLHWIPTWLDEGMANFYGYTRFQNHQIFVGAPPNAYSKMPAGTWIPVETLIGVDQSSPYYHSEDKVFQFYAESWALVHFMMFGPDMERGERLNKFASLLQQGVEQKKAFEQSFGPFAQMNDALFRYVNKFAFQTGVLPDPPHINDKAFETHELTMPQTEAELSAFHLWTHDWSDARPLAEEAIKGDPKLGLAHEVMGYLDFADAKDSDALNEFSKASELDPSLFLSSFAKTMMSPIAASNVPADRVALEAALLKVLSSNPQFAPAYVQLARLALSRDDYPNAFGLARKAEQLEPTRAGYHLLSGRILLRMGKGAEAAAFARFVAERWRGPDHDEALELWNAIPAAELPAGVSFVEPLPKDVQIADGRVLSAACPAKEDKDQPWTFTISSDGKNLTFRRKGGFPAGFTDTIWYGHDHFNLCHHLEGMRAVIRYKAAPDSTYAGDIAELEIRDDPPRGPAKESAAAAKP